MLVIIDYYDVEKIINPLIEKLDHSFMVNKNDKVVLEFLEKMNSKKVIVDFNSTAENICSYLLSEIKKCSLPSNISSAMTTWRRREHYLCSTTLT